MRRKDIERASVHHSFKEHFGEMNIYFTCYFLNRTIYLHLTLKILYQTEESLHNQMLSY